MVAYTTTYNLKKPTVADDEDVWGGYLNDSMDIIDDVLDGTVPVTGIDINSGTIDNAVIGGTTPVAGTFTALTATGNITVSGTVDGRDVAADGTKLDGIESGATADQTKADIDALGIAASTASTLATARNIALSGDVSGSANFDGSANISITATVADDSHNHVISNVDGLQTALDGKLSTSGKAADSNLLDGIDSGSFLRSDANDTASGIITLSSTARDALNFSGNATDDHRGVAFNGRAALTADYNDGYLRLNNASEFSNGVFTPGVIRADGGFNVNGATVWNSSNDGSGSGLDADTLDGLQLNSTTRNNQANVVVRTQSNGYAEFGWINTTSGDTTSGLSRIYVDTGDGYIRKSTLAHVASQGGYHVNSYANNMTANQALADDWFRSIGNTGWYNNTHGGGIYMADSTWVQVYNSKQFLVNNKAKADSWQELYTAKSGTSVTIDADTSGAFSLSMSGNTTFTFSAVDNSVSVGFILQLTGNGSTVTWPSSVDWAGGTAPDAPASGETDIYVFWTRNGGSTWYGVQSIDAAA